AAKHHLVTVAPERTAWAVYPDPGREREKRRLVTVAPTSTAPPPVVSATSDSARRRRVPSPPCVRSLYLHYSRAGKGRGGRQAMPGFAIPYIRCRNEPEAPRFRLAG